MEEKTKHPAFEQPYDKNIKVWRYMNLEKLKDLISTQELYLSRVDCLKDKHEGSKPKPLIEGLREFWKSQVFGDKVLDWWSQIAKQTTESAYVNCWRIDTHESNLMWNNYVKGGEIGIVIQTTYDKLLDSINYDDSIYLGKIKYIDFEKEYWSPDNNAFFPIMHKRKEFESEQEVRIVKSDPTYWGLGSPDSPKGVRCKWDFNKTVENIYINPSCTQEEFDEIKKYLASNNVNITPQWSSLKREPEFG
ncbi:MAG: hypothetical protein V4509_00930 [Patescibacteria group bacterium]